MGDPGRRDTGVGGNTGHAHVYIFDTAIGEWAQLGPNVLGDSAGTYEYADSLTLYIYRCTLLLSAFSHSCFVMIA